MRVTNKLNLPAALVSAVSRERHNEPNSYSATTLIKGVKEIILTLRHWDELEADAADSIWAIWGTAVHAIFEKQKDETFKEEFFSVPVGEKSRITGTVDSYDLENAIITDWKTASIWKVQFQDFEDWRRQGLIYAWLLTQTGLEVKKCRFVAILKDHSKSKARRDSQYPQSPVYVYEFLVTEKDLQDIGEFIKSKVADIEASLSVDDDTVSPCSNSERWADDEKFAVMKTGRKSALRVFDNREDAEKMAAECGAGHSVEHRPAESKKCADYCPCKEFCSFYKNEVEK